MRTTDLDHSLLFGQSVGEMETKVSLNMQKKLVEIIKSLNKCLQRSYILSVGDIKCVAKSSIF